LKGTFKIKGPRVCLSEDIPNKQRAPLVKPSESESDAGVQQPCPKLVEVHMRASEDNARVQLTLTASSEPSQTYEGPRNPVVR
jgi:hypothetical protein